MVTSDRSRYRLFLDAGNITYGSRKYDLLKFDYILKGMEMMGYDVANLGATESMLDKRDLLAMVQRHPALRFISCNVVDARSRRPVVQPYAVKDVGGYRVGLLGVVRADLEVVGKGLAVTPPIEALSEWVPHLAKRCDYIVVTAFVNQETLEEIAGKFYEVEAILGGDVQESSNYPEEINQAMVFSVTDKGKVLGRIRLRRSAKGGLEVATGEVLAVKEEVPDDPKMLKLVEEFKEELRRRQTELAQSDEHLEPIAAPERSSLADRYVGAEACKACHKLAYQVWKTSPHVRSLESLKPRKSQYDPECLACHTLGYGASDGFIGEEKTPKFAIVQCENCHGRGSKHMEAMERGEKLMLSTFRAVTPNTCVRCHDKENSEDFDFTTFWPRIAHR